MKRASPEDYLETERGGVAPPPRSGVFKQALKLFAVSLLAAVLSGCGEHDHEHAKDGGEDHSHNADGSHSDSAESFSGATHKEGAGITLLDETRQLLGLETVEAREVELPREVRFTARVFDTDATQLRVLGTVPTSDAAFLNSGLKADFKSASGATVTGVIQHVSTPVKDDEAEIIAAFRNESATFKQGEFGDITVSVPSGKKVLAVPSEAVIKGATGHLVYAVNGDAYILTWVELGAESGGWVEITDGLLAGDSVVMRGAMDLWLVELRAVKGGQGCCPAPPKKGKS